MIIQFDNRQSKYRVRIWRQLLKDNLAAAFELLPFNRYLQRRDSEASIMIIFAGEDEMRQINLAARANDSVTDVLSFPLLDMAGGKMQKPLADADYDWSRRVRKTAVPLGDIVICLERAFSQAADLGHTPERELTFLAVHGLLHLLGFDHLEPGQEKSMLTWQRKIMHQLGLGRRVKNKPIVAGSPGEVPQSAESADKTSTAAMPEEVQP